MCKIYYVYEKTLFVGINQYSCPLNYRNTNWIHCQYLFVILLDIFCTILKKIRTSAYKRNSVYFIWYFMSFNHILNKIGPNIDLWGTPERGTKYFDRNPFITILTLRPFKYCSNRFRSDPAICCFRIINYCIYLWNIYLSPL